MCDRVYRERERKRKTDVLARLVDFGRERREIVRHLSKPRGEPYSILSDDIVDLHRRRPRLHISPIHRPFRISLSHPRPERLDDDEDEDVPGFTIRETISIRSRLCHLLEITTIFFFEDSAAFKERCGFLRHDDHVRSIIHSSSEEDTHSA